MHLKSTESCRRAPKTEITTMIHIDLSGKVILLTGAMGAIAEHMVKRLNAAGATQHSRPSHLYVRLCGTRAPHPDSLLCLRKSRARKLCPVHGSGVCIHGRPRECSFARECCGGKFA